MARWWKEQEHAVATAVDKAEKLSGHQIVVWVGNLGRHPDRTADRLAVKYARASLVFCVDPQHRCFEMRWSAGLDVDSDRIVEAARNALRDEDLPRAIRQVAGVLPRLDEGEELPDIVEG
jgi:hypothetical protein